MKPDENDNRRMGTPLIPQRSYISTPPQSHQPDASQTAAANVIRSQLDSIYSGNTATPTPQTTPVVASAPITQQDISESNPYARTQVNPAEVQANQWKQYHSAWQDYYQKYYERYYVGQVYRTKQALEEKATQAALLSPSVAVAAPAPTPTLVEATPEPANFSREEAMYDLRTKLLTNIQSSAVKVRKSRHFIPISAALVVVLLFLFLQYNRVLFANVQAYIAPGNVDPANIIVDPSTNVVVGQEPKLIIPKINVDVPVDYTAQPDYDSQMNAMKGGVAYFGIPGANSKPGQVGNTVIAGHSSNDVTDPGDYKFIFARLDALNTGDTIYLNYQGVRYVYSVTKKEVVKPTDVQALIYPTEKPVITLLTCTPIGTALNRLLVTAEQISPDPGKAEPAPSSDGTLQPASIPGNSPTFLQRIFGGDNS